MAPISVSPTRTGIAPARASQVGLAARRAATAASLFARSATWPLGISNASAALALRALLRTPRSAAPSAASTRRTSPAESSTLTPTFWSRPLQVSTATLAASSASSSGTPRAGGVGGAGGALAASAGAWACTREAARAQAAARTVNRGFMVGSGDGSGSGREARAALQCNLRATQASARAPWGRSRARLRDRPISCSMRNTGVDPRPPPLRARRTTLRSSL